MGGKEKKRKRKKRKREKEKGKEREGEIRAENFGSDHDVGRACTAVAGACRGFGRKWRARNKGNRVMGWGLDSGVGTGEDFGELGV